MVQINPFCDSDLRNGLLFLSGINLMIGGISMVVDVLVIAEISYFSHNWNHDDLKFSPSAAQLLMILDILLISLQIFYGLKLYKAVLENAYSKIQKWEFPSLLLLGTEMLILLIYMIAMPLSAYFYYFTAIELMYKSFIFWPVHRYLKEVGNIPVTENSRLLGCVN